MHLQFLCPALRSLVQNDPAYARNTWLMSYDKALAFAAAGHLEQAINAAGSALDAAEILIREHALCDNADLNRFTESAILLRGLLKQLDDSTLVSGLVGGCVSRLDWAIARGASRQFVLQCCQRILESSEQEYTRVPRPLLDHKSICHRDPGSRSLH